jgi:hypothetical protein
MALRPVTRRLIRRADGEKLDYSARKPWRLARIASRPAK